MILRYIFRTVFIWLIARVLGRYLPFLRRLPGLFR